MLSSRLSRFFFVPARSHTGYIPFEGKLGFVPKTDEKRFDLECTKVNLQPVKKISYQFDPFRPNVRSIRYTMNKLSYRRTRATNIKCQFKTEVLSDGSDPLIKVELNDGRLIKIKAGTLSEFDIVSNLNRILLPLVVEEDTQSTSSKPKPAGKKKK